MNRQCVILGIMLFSSVVFGQEKLDSTNNKVYDIQDVKILGHIQNKDRLTNKVVAKDIYKFEKSNVTDALNLLPGISIAQFGARNEGTLLLRGFDNRRTPVYYDGVPVYAPYDGNFDLSRFMTYDIENISVEKGLVSVKFGSNAMGGAVNMVSKKPTKVFDANARLGIGFANYSGVNSYFSSVNIGTRQNKYYVMGTASFDKVDDFVLSKSFNINKIQSDIVRNRSASFDSKLSAKFGYIPNKTDEYSFDILRQTANKNIAQSVLTTNNSSFRDYPTYDKTSIYLKTKTKVIDKTFVNFTGYYDSYYNIMKQFDDNRYLLQNKNSSFSSVYDDYTLGGILTASTEIIKDNAITLTINEKYDHHKEYNAEISANATIGQKLKVGEPEQSYKDNTLFIGLEDVFTLNQFKFIAGGSFSYRNNILAQDYGKTATSGKNSVLYDFPKSEENVFDYKFGVIFTPADGHHLTFSASKRSRFASQKERYSFRFGRFIPNPDLKSEFTYAFDLTYSRKISDYLQYEVSGFFNSIRNAILDRTIDDINNISQNVNIGKVVSRGFEASFGYSPIRYIILGGNYSFIEMMDKTEANEHFTNVPRHKIVGYGTFEIPQIKITINTNIEYYGKRYRTSQGEQTPDFTLVNAKLSYKITRMLNFDFGVKNLLDKDYYWSYGYPMAGRQFITSLNYNF